MHFVKPDLYRRMVPQGLPAPGVLVCASGLAEAAGGIGLMRPSTRRWAGWWLAATLVAVFPANVHMALNPDEYQGMPGGRRALVARLPVQALFIWWALAASRSDE